MTGTKVRIWKQDPSVNNPGVRSAYIHTPVEAGPRDGDVEIRGVPTVIANADGDFLFDAAENPLEFDAVHTFTVVRQVLTMYRRALNRNGVTQNFDWQWGDEPIAVYPRAGLDANAYYSREEQSLRFFYFHPGNNEALPRIYTNRSFDIVAHECGHAVLDSLRPGYWDSLHPQTGGLHESFGDITAILTMLAQLDQCDTIVAESKADLHNKSFFPALAEQFGAALGRPMGLRNADNDLKMSEVSNEVHAVSQVFTGAFYDILADIHDDYQKPDEYDQAETLFRIGKHMTALIILALVNGPQRDATFADIARKMIEIEPVEKWKGFIDAQFARREVLGPRAMTLAPETAAAADYSRCCGTLCRHAPGAHAAGKADGQRGTAQKPKRSAAAKR